MRTRLFVGATVLIGLAAVILSGWLEALSVANTELDIVGLLVFAMVGFGLELGEHRLALGSATGSIAFIIYIAAALVFGPTWCTIIAGLSITIAQLAIRKPAIKIVFNVSQNVAALVAATAVYLSLGGEVPPRALDAAILPLFGLVLTYLLINSSAVSGAIAISEGRQFGDVWVRNTWSLATYDLIASAFGLGIAWVYSGWGVIGMAGVVLPILFLRHTYLVNLRLQATNRELLELMVKSIEARDPYTSGHSQRVSEIARALARDLGLSFSEVDQIATAALLHDVGKIYEEFAPILRKQGRLTDEEQALMRSHPVRSAELVSTISNLRGYVEKCVRHHHESFNGTGYPEGLGGDAIPIGARIVLVADTSDAMTTDRPYRRALTYDGLVRELDRYAGIQFDPRVVEVFKRSVTVRRLLGASRPATAVVSADRRPERIAELPVPVSRVGATAVGGPMLT
jgi:putative nucleotidyltransferase with HDIG domain